MDFKEGDVVILKSGSPDMTIEEYPIVISGIMSDDEYDYKRARCSWFLNGERKKDTFNVLSLEKK